MWPRLSQLFGYINEGEEELGVPTYNGGLFDPAKHPFLEKHAVGDRRLEQAIDMLTRVDNQFVDYRDLAVRHLGTIYEGLLEYHLAPCDEPRWTITLVNAKGERKATGSYYTPEYIVNYIVEATLGPTLDEAARDATSPDDLTRRILDLKVLDPAMGSGHFLVAATEFIARRLVALDARPGPAPTPRPTWPTGSAASSPRASTAWTWNPLAVELAKLSLWLSTVAQDRPLSFLDHHLRPGNSLVGARLANLEHSPRPSPAPARRSPPRPRPSSSRCWTTARSWSPCGRRWIRCGSSKKRPARRWPR